MSRSIVYFVTAFLFASALPCQAADWPMWRYDSGRTATSPDALPAELKLAWAKKFSQREQTWDDTLNNDLMQYDRVFEPIVVGDHVIVGFNDSDKVVAWNVKSGEEAWQFFTGGPVRMPPASANGKVYVTSDDGHLYCLDAVSGDLAWKFRGGPGNRKVLGNRRVVSMWPARGGAVVRDGHVYFAASIWPFMGTFLYDLDAETGKVVWVNDSTSASYIKQPHSAAAFAGVAPQGTLVATEDYLLVPGGRSVPAAFDRETGELVHFELNAGGKGSGGSFVMSDDKHFYVHTRQRGVRRFDLQSGKKTALMLNEPVFDGELLITSDEKAVKAIRSNDNGTEQEVVWEVATDGRGDLIRAGNQLYVGGETAISVIEIAADSMSAKVTCTLPFANAERLVAGGETLIAVSLDGRIGGFRVDGSGRFDAGKHEHPDGPAHDPEMVAFLRSQDAANGWAFVYGVEDHSFLDDLIASSQLQIVAVSPDRSVVERLRKHYDRLDYYGSRITVHEGTASDFLAPPYIAHLVAFAGKDATGLKPDEVKAMYRSVRPYGGLLWLPEAEKTDTVASAIESSQLTNAVKLDAPTGHCFARSGALAGAAPWTHLYGDVANTVKSNDQLVKAPLGILWFGGNTHHDVLPRHSHAPCEQVIGGRLFVEGVNSLSARDVYTGRVMWRREFEDLGTSGIYYDRTYPRHTAEHAVQPGPHSRCKRPRNELCRDRRSNLPRDR